MSPWWSKKLGFSGSLCSQLFVSLSQQVSVTGFATLPETFCRYKYIWKHINIFVYVLRTQKLLIQGLKNRLGIDSHIFIAALLKIYKRKESFVNSFLHQKSSSLSSEKGNKRFLVNLSTMLSKVLPQEHWVCFPCRSPK